MKKILYIFVSLILLHFSCSSDDSSNNLRIVYEQHLMENTFLQTGETAPPVVNWSEEKGTFSATTLTAPKGDDLVGKGNLYTKLH
ncbi:hypothetical protein [Flavivirga algicola]|uniref:Uncharacterized protein n=1 Tax=Flavivirga algicola TaxID=2729136 RepID=A0ABX1S3M7_9FLAO|nr:hypothetical protein [Flavivirga algicola]NMH89140.1 hypothetical protein [Flavivirga algicola]